MYTKEQIEIALKEFDRLDSVQASTLYRWYEHKLANKQNYHASPEKTYLR